MTKTYCVDIDGTICTNTDGAYDDAEPFADVIQEVNRLFEDGHRILLYTARGSTTKIDWRTMTERQLRDWGVKYHELSMGKPSADIYVDDKSITADAWRASKFSLTLEMAKRSHGRLDPDPPIKSGRVVYFNGEFVPECEARLSIYDSALMFGDMIFEMTRSFGKEQFKLRQHLERLYAGLKVLRIPLAMTLDEMEEVVFETVQRNDHLFRDDDEHRIMIDVSRGLLGIYQDIEDLPRGPNVIVADFPLRWTVAGMGHLFDTGINAVITSQRAIPAKLLDPKVKNRSRVHYLMANIEASQFVGDDNWALLLDPDGFIAEGTGDNFFIVKDGVLITPQGRNILRGVSRAYVMNELADQIGAECIERNIEPYDVHTADEAFMTGTPFCMLPVTSLNGLAIGNSDVGPVYTRLLETWGGNLGVDIAKQIKVWDAQKLTGTTDSPTPYRFGKKS